MKCPSAYGISPSNRKSSGYHRHQSKRTGVSPNWAPKSLLIPVVQHQIRYQSNFLAKHHPNLHILMCAEHHVAGCISSQLRDSLNAAAASSAQILPVPLT